MQGCSAGSRGRLGRISGLVPARSALRQAKVFEWAYLETSSFLLTFRPF